MADSPNVSKQEGFIYGYVTKYSETQPWEEGERKGDGIGRVKVGQTNRDVDKRIREQQTNNPDGLQAWARVLIDTNVREDGTLITDKEVLNALRGSGVYVVGRSEWVEATPDEIKRCITCVKTRTPFVLDGSRSDFELRPEQANAISRTMQRFKEQAKAGVPRSMLWNAKMRFGKSFASLQLARAIKAKRVLVLTWFPSVLPEWYGCITGHVDFENWYWTDDVQNPSEVNTPSVHFVSAQALFNDSENGAARRRNLKSIDWDLFIVDEQHWGADKSKGRQEVYELNLNTQYRLELSGTPFGDLESGHFGPEDTYSWSYTDEQQAKHKWKVENEDDPISRELEKQEDHPRNPWHGMPRMEWRVYDLAEIVGEQIEADESWTLTDMFAVDASAFVYDDLVRKWLETISKRKKASQRYYPYERRPGGGFHEEAAKHSVWVMEGIPQCSAMAALLPQIDGFADVEVISAFGSDESGMSGQSALTMVREAIANSERTITLTCSMLLTGVTVPQWGVIGMLQPGSSMARYLQAAFRVQSPHVTGSHVHKPSAYVFDFDPNRALTVVSNYADAVAETHPDIPRQNTIESLCRFIEFIWHEDGDANRLSAEELMVYSSQTIGRLYMARRWASGHFVNVDAVLDAENLTLIDILNRVRQHKRPSSMATDVTITSNPELAGKAESSTKPQGGETRGGSDTLKNRKRIRDKLTKLLSSIPMFMYLTEERERALVDVIESVDTELFQDVTGITIEEFQELRDAGAYDENALNQAVLKFREEEAKSLGYLGVDPPSVSDAGWSTTNTSSD